MQTVSKLRLIKFKKKINCSCNGSFRYKFYSRRISHYAYITLYQCSRTFIIKMPIRKLFVYLEFKKYARLVVIRAFWFIFSSTIKTVYIYTYISEAHEDACILLLQHTYGAFVINSRGFLFLDIIVQRYFHDLLLYFLFNYRHPNW